MHMEALVLFEPGLHFRMFVRGVVVDDKVQLKVPGRLPLDFLEEVQPLLMPVLALDRTDQPPLKVIERSEQGHGAMANVIVRLRADMADAQRQSRFGTLQGLSLTFFIAAQHQCLVRRSRYNPMTSQNFSSKLGSLDSLNVRVRCGFMSLAAHIRWTLAGEIPATCAMLRQLQRGWPIRG